MYYTNNEILAYNAGLSICSNYYLRVDIEVIFKLS